MKQNNHDYTVSISPRPPINCQSKSLSLSSLPTLLHPVDELSRPRSFSSPIPLSRARPLFVLQVSSFPGARAKSQGRNLESSAGVRRGKDRERAQRRRDRFFALPRPDSISFYELRWERDREKKGKLPSRRYHCTAVVLPPPLVR